MLISDGSKQILGSLSFYGNQHQLINWAKYLIEFFLSNMLIYVNIYFFFSKFILSNIISVSYFQLFEVKKKTSRSNDYREYRHTFNSCF